MAAVAAAPVVVTAAATQPIESLSDRLGNAVARSVQEMAAESEQALRTKKATQGVFYPGDLIHLLEASKEHALLEGARNQKCFINGWVNADYFDSVVEKLPDRRRQIRCFSFIAKDEVTASEALKAAKTGLRILDCGNVCEIALYDALLQELGEDKFNRLFSKEHGQKLNIGFTHDEVQPMRYFCRFTEAAIQQIPGQVGSRRVQVGDVVSFNGVDEYRKKHPNGMGSNYNVVCIDATPGSQKYVGHGLSAKGAAEAEIALLMANEYNQKPDHFSRVPPKGYPFVRQILQDRNSASLAKDRVRTNKPLKVVRGFDRGSPMALRADVIAALIELPLEQVSMDYVLSYLSRQAQGDNNKEPSSLVEKADNKDNE